MDRDASTIRVPAADDHPLMREGIGAGFPGACLAILTALRGLRDQSARAWRRESALEAA